MCVTYSWYVICLVFEHKHSAEETDQPAYQALLTQEHTAGSEQNTVFCVIHIIFLHQDSPVILQNRSTEYQNGSGSDGMLIILILNTSQIHYVWHFF